MTKSFKPNWDLYALALAALFIFYQALQWPLLPKFVDIYYHLGVVKGFSDAGGWTPVDTWEFAPDGRPHLYPPLLHFLLVIPYRLGLSAISIARLVDVAAYPALLASFWLFVRGRAGSRVAFWALFLFSSVYSACLASVTLPAFNLAMIGALLALHLLASGRAVAAGLMAAAVCYTHALAAALLGLAAVAAALFDPALRKSVVRAAGPALLLSLPMWIWLVLHRGAFTMTSSPEGRLVEWDPLIYGLAAIRLIRGFRQRRLDIWPCALLLAMAPVVPFRQARIVGGYGVLPAAWLAALEVLSWYEAISGQHRRKALVLGTGAAALFFAFLAPSCFWQAGEGFRLQAMDRTLSRYVFPDPERDFRAKGFSIYFEKEYREMADILEARLAPDEVFWTDFPHAGGILYLMTGRAMSTAMLGEVGDWKDRPARIRNAKLLVWFKDSEGRAAGEVLGLMASLKLRPVAETDLAYIFENPAGGSRSRPPKAALPLPLGWGLLSLWAGAVLYASMKKFD